MRVSHEEEMKRRGEKRYIYREKRDVQLLRSPSGGGVLPLGIRGKRLRECLLCACLGSPALSHKASTGTITRRNRGEEREDRRKRHRDEAKGRGAREMERRGRTGGRGIRRERKGEMERRWNDEKGKEEGEGDGEESGKREEDRQLRQETNGLLLLLLLSYTLSSLLWRSSLAPRRSSSSPFDPTAPYQR